MSRSFLEITNEFADYDDVVESRKNTPLSLREKLPIIQIVGICSSLISIQVAHCIEFALQVPLLRKLGLSYIFIAIITFSGPFSSSIVQPFIESASDNCKSKVGRRRPFLFFGGIGAITSFIAMYFLDSMELTNRFIISLFFSIALFLLNISIQLLQHPSHSIITDLVPQGQQPIANLIALLVSTISSILFGLGCFFILTYSHEKNIFLFSISVVFVSIAITLIIGKEEPLLISKENHLINPFSSIFSSVKLMPTAILRILIVYFLCWASFYPFILECSDFFGIEIYNGLHQFNDSNYQKGTSFGFLTFSLLNLFILIYKPFQDKAIQRVGMKNVLIASQILEGCLLIFVLFCAVGGCKSTAVYLIFFSFMGIPAVVFCTIPFSIVELSVQAENVSTYYGLMSISAAIGQQVSAFLFFALIGSFKINKGIIIGLGFLSAFASAVMCTFVVLPNVASTIMEPLAPSADYYND